MDQKKCVAIKVIQPTHYPTFTYKGEPIQVMQSFEYFGINVPLTNRCNVYNESDFKWVGIVIICSRINATKVILKDGK